MRCGLALGGNLGERDSCFQSTISEFNSHPAIEVQKVSSLYQTAPIGSDAGETYWNAAIIVETELSPTALHEVCLKIEADHGRERTIHWGPRTLDIDLICYGREIVQTETLTIPHLACWYRRFVLDPICEIGADLWHPVWECTFQELKERLLERPLTVNLEYLEQRQKARLSELLKNNFAPGEITQTTGIATFTLLGDQYAESRPQGKWVLKEDDLPGPFEDFLSPVLGAAIDTPRINETRR